MRQAIKELEAIVVEVIRETADTTTLVLFTGNESLDYEPGHFLTISPHQFPWLDRWIKYFEDVKNRKEPPRAYSLASIPEEKYLAITVKEERYLSGSTLYPPLLSPSLAHQTPVGSKMVITGFTGPYTLATSFAKMKRSPEQIVHICAGSGIVPSYSIIKQDLKHHGTRKHLLFYSNRTLADTIFYSQLRALERLYPERFQVIYTLTQESNEALFHPNMRKGRISFALLQEYLKEPSSVAVFTCGPDYNVWRKKMAKEQGQTLPPSFLESVLSYLEQLHIQPNQICKESYG